MNWPTFKHNLCFIQSYKTLQYGLKIGKLIFKSFAKKYLLLGIMVKTKHENILMEQLLFLNNTNEKRK